MRQRSYIPRKTAILDVIKFLVELPHHNISDKENKNYDKIIVETLRMIDRELSGLLAHPESPYTNEYNNFIGLAFPGGLERTDKGKDFLLFLNKGSGLNVVVKGKKQQIPVPAELRNPEKGIAGVIGNYLAINIFTQRGIILEKLLNIEKLASLKELDAFKNSGSSTDTKKLEELENLVTNPKWKDDLDANTKALEVLNALPAPNKDILRNTFSPMLSEITRDLQINVTAINMALEVLKAINLLVENQNQEINIDDRQAIITPIDNQNKINKSLEALEILNTWARYRNFLADPEANSRALEELKTATIPTDSENRNSFIKKLGEVSKKFHTNLEANSKELELLKTVTKQTELLYMSSLELFLKGAVFPLFYSIIGSPENFKEQILVKPLDSCDNKKKFVQYVRLSQIDRGLGGGRYIEGGYR